MARPKTHALSLFLAGAALALPALAARPLHTEDAEVPGRGACEVEGWTERLLVDEARATEHALQYGCGLGLPSQVALNASRARDGDERNRGLALVGKTGLWAGAGDHPAGLALAWSLQWARADSGSRRHRTTELNLVYSRPLPADLTLHANIGHARDERGGQRSATWGLALEHEGFGHLAPTAEFFGDDRGPAWWNLGLGRTLVHDRLPLNASCGRQLSSSRPRLFTAGFKIEF